MVCAYGCTRNIVVFYMAVFRARCFRMATVTPVGARSRCSYRVKKVKGRCYFVKEYWDPVLRKKVTRSIGPCDLVDKVMEAVQGQREAGY